MSVEFRDYLEQLETEYQDEQKKNLRIINLTPHEVVLRLDGKSDITFPASGYIARLDNISARETLIETSAGGIPVLLTRLGLITELELLSYRRNTMYIVSTLVAQKLERPDCLAPDTGETAIREAGQVVAVRRFLMFSREEDSMGETEREFINEALSRALDELGV